MPKVFISYSSADRKTIEEIAQKLIAAGINVWYDDWEVNVGDSIVQKINDGIGSSDYLIVALSKNSLKSHWVKEELSAATALLAKKGSFILPVLLDDCEVPPLLAHRRYADYQRDPSEAMEQIVEAIRGMPKSGDSHDQARMAQAILSAMISGYAREIREAKSEVDKIQIKGELVNKISYIAQREEMPPEVFMAYVDCMLNNKAWLTIPEFLTAIRNPDAINSWSTDVGQQIVDWLFKVMMKTAPQGKAAAEPE